MSKLEKNTQLINRRSFLAGGSAITGAALAGVITPVQSRTKATINEAIKLVNLNDTDLQTVINEAPDHSILVCKSDQPITVNETIVIHKPVILIGLRARLADHLEDTEILSVEAEGVAIENFELKGNAKDPTVDLDQRASLIQVVADHFRIENGLVTDSSKHGIGIRAFESDRKHGVVRNIIGRRISRDTVSLTGRGNNDSYVRNILVENISTYGPSLRGAVESSDGTSNITIRNIYAESCNYGIDVQDHSRRGQSNKNIYIDGVYVNDCTSAIITQNDPDFGHRYLTIRNVTGENWPDKRWKDHKRIHIKNTSNVILENARVAGNTMGEDVCFSNCDDLTLNNLVIEHANHDEPAVLLRNCGNIHVDGLKLINATDKLQNVLHYQVSQGLKHNVQITNVIAPNLEHGITITRDNPNATLKNYMIRNNLTGVLDRIGDHTALISDNIL